MQAMNSLLSCWDSINTEFMELKKKKELYEKEIRKTMISNHWQDYKSDRLKVYIIEKEVKTIDESELPLLLNKSDIEKITRRRLEKSMLIITPEAERLMNKKIKGMK